MLAAPKVPTLPHAPISPAQPVISRQPLHNEAHRSLQPDGTTEPLRHHLPPALSDNNQDNLENYYNDMEESWLYRQCLETMDQNTNDFRKANKKGAIPREHSYESTCKSDDYYYNSDEDGSDYEYRHKAVHFQENGHGRNHVTNEYDENGIKLYSHLEWEQRQLSNENCCSRACRCLRCRKWTSYCCCDLLTLRIWSVVCYVLLGSAFIACFITLMVLSCTDLKNWVKASYFLPTKCSPIYSE